MEEKVKNLIPSLILIFSTLCFFTSVNAQWYDKTKGLPDASCYAYAIDAYDSLIATGPYTFDSLYITTDGGNNWYTRPLPDIAKHIVDISIIGKDKIWFCTAGSKIYGTTDGGFNWQLQFYDTLKTDFMNYIEMFDSLNGMAMGDAPASDKPALFLKTTNGGNDWISQNETSLIGFESGDLWRRVDFVDINTGYFYSSGGPQKLYKTTNSGKDWEVLNDTIQCFVLKAYDENIFLGEYPGGNVYRTLDGGQNWESYSSDTLDWGLDIEFTPGNPANVWYSAGGDFLFFSSDTGRIWAKESDGQYGLIYDIVFTDENSGWLLSGSGGMSHPHIYRTTNGGQGGIVLGVENDKESVPNNFRLEQNYPNPFNPTTKIKYTIPSVGTQHAVSIQLMVYDVLGREIATLVNEGKSPGSYEVEFTATGLPSGIYFYRLKAGSYIETKKMILLK